MDHQDFVIIGDGVAGATAAETIRETDEDASITILTDEDRPLYNRVLIKEVAKGKMPGEVTQIHEEDWYDERDIDLRLNTRVVDVAPDAHTVETAAGDVIKYGKLLIATGGTPRPLPVENGDADGIDYFWTFADAQRISENASAAETGVIVGAGLLGIDLAATCGAQDVNAHYLMRGNRWWRYALSEDGAEIIHDGLRDQGVTPVFESGVDRFEVDDDGQVTTAVDTNGDHYDADFAGVAIGLEYNTDFLDDTDIEVEHGIFVDEHMRTNIEDVYAAGDITRYYDVLLEERTQNGSWDSAKEQGQVAAQNMLADEPVEAFRFVSSYSITHFDFPFLSFGHPTAGDTTCERKYSEDSWRKLAFKDGRLVGGVLIGNLAPQSALKDLMREKKDVAHLEDQLLAEDFTGGLSD